MTAAQSMPMWSHLALNAYYYASLPSRCRRRIERARAGQAPLMILFYHRVANEGRNPWTIRERTFARQVHWLQRNFELISLAETQSRIASGENAAPAACLTFDDGYADNSSFALPRLIREQIPVTYFVTTHNLLTGEPFPHDVALGKPLQPNTVDQLKSLVDAGIEIGAHTQTHADLGKINDEEQLQREVIACREELQTTLSCPVRYFAFPFGLHENLNAEAFHLAHTAGYDGVCSAYGGYNFPGDDPFHLQRIHADPQMIRLKNWLTVDPRKESMVRRYKYAKRPMIVPPAGSAIL